SGSAETRTVHVNHVMDPSCDADTVLSSKPHGCERPYPARARALGGRCASVDVALGHARKAAARDFFDWPHCIVDVAAEYSSCFVMHARLAPSVSRGVTLA